MQFLKGDIQERILKVAEEVFLEKGYKDASMREIASRAGVTVSNIYHYFTNKDEIFRTILKPVLNDLYAMIYNHDADQMTIDVFMDSDYQKTSVREYIRLVSEHRDRLRLLLFQAQGSVLENFRSEYTDLMTRTISVFFQGMKQKYPHINIAITNFFIHLNTVWLFALLEELVLHPVKKEEMEKFIAEYIVFETAGWKGSVVILGGLSLVNSLHAYTFASLKRPQFLHVMLRACTLVQRIHLNSPYSFLPLTAC